MLAAPPSGRLLHAYVSASAAATPDAPALHVDGITLSYHALQSAADNVRHRIAACGLQQGGATVGLLCEKGPAAYAGLVGTMASGNVYVPLNPRFPLARLATIAGLAELSALVVDASCASIAEAVAARVDRRIQVIASDAPPSAEGASPAVPVPPSQVAYLMFTSGSSGVPKGVPVTHESACACIEAVSAELPLDERDRVTQLSELCFDVSIGEMFVCWRAGACLYAPTFAERLKPLDFVNKFALTVWSSVPTMAVNLRLLDKVRPNSLPSIRLSLFCGEVLPAAVAARWQAAAPHSLVVNLYGPTEASIFATFHVYSEGTSPCGSVVPIGRALRGFEYRIAQVDGDPPSVVASDGSLRRVGELWLSGPQVVSEYWRNDAATEGAFVRDRGNRTWYRTGDLVSDDDNIGLSFLGRRDHQVKVRGHRIEPSEVEQVLRDVSGSPGVAVVPVFAADRRCVALVAFVAGTRVTMDELRRRCRSRVPDYMVPQRIVEMDALPLNSNGKVDYQQLSAKGEALWTRLHE
jgi:D-alanine--poly(phosphoribitol) ligase subunit 1